METSDRPPPPPQPDSVTRLLRGARMQRGLTTRELASAIGVSPGFITLIETGRKRPSVEKVRALAKVLGLPEGPLVAWVELGGQYDRKSLAAGTIARYLDQRSGEEQVMQAKPRSRAHLMMARLLGRAPREPEREAEYGALRPGLAGAMPSETLLYRSGAPRIPVLAEGADPSVALGAAAPSPDAITLDLSLFPSGIPIEEPWAYRISAVGARHAPDVLEAGDLVVLTRHAWPVFAGEVYALTLGGRIELCRAAWKGEALVVMLADGVELLRLPAPDTAPAELRGLVVLVVRAPGPIGGLTRPGASPP